MVKLSKRMERLADMVTGGGCLADVGTDHGYVPIYLCEKKRILAAVAMDVRRGPLERAEAHIREAGLEAYIETRLSDGLEGLRAGEAHTVLIAGMGGPLTVRILSDGQEKLEGAGELILQPQSEIAKVRRWLSENGYEIVREDTVLEDGKFYPMFRAVPGSPKEAYTEEEYRYGRPELQHSPDVWKEFLGKRLEEQKGILAHLPGEREGQAARIRKRRMELKEEIRVLEKMLERLSAGT